MPFNQASITELTALLPQLSFVVAEDCSAPKAQAIADYLDFYRINFSKEFDSLNHGFGYVETPAFKIATHYWLPKNPAGTAVVMHGYYDHVGLFAHPIRFALQQNFAVLAFDLPGHGLSSGEPATIDSFNEYGDVLHHLLLHSQPLLPQPLYAIGQSTGCAVILNYLWRYAAQPTTHAPQLDNIVLCAPLIVARSWRTTGKYLYLLLRHFIQRLPRHFALSSHDEAFNTFLKHQDPLQATHLSVRWVGAMSAWHDMFRQFPPLNNKVLLIQGTQDETVDWAYNTALIRQKLPATRVATIMDARHQLMNESEPYRTRLFSTIEDHLLNPQASHE